MDARGLDEKVTGVPFDAVGLHTTRGRNTTTTTTRDSKKKETLLFFRTLHGSMEPTLQRQLATDACCGLLKR